MPKAIDLTGESFGRLTCTQRIVENSKSYYMCDCECGNQKKVSLFNLRGGQQSCGCLRSEVVSKEKTKSLVEVITTQVMNYYKRNASNRNILWDISRKKFQELILSPCYYCGVVGGNATYTTWSSRNGEKRIFRNNGVDRLDNNKGYTTDNCVPCCKRCNFAKRDDTEEEFKNWILAAARHIRKRE